MIEAERVTKIYPGTVALDEVSFQVAEREVVGFLGPNGAGKTTMLRILSCFIPPTSGKASVAGFDVFEDSLNVRKRIGYLPENVPLYPEMRADEYLKFRARLKGVPRKDVRKRLDYAVERCGVSDVRHRIIGQLSKGYRQRVGLADCLLSNPQILLLDEPTIGLDPNQIRQVRELIRELGHEHTVFLSTHILPEVEMICNRVIIIHKGRIVASDTMQNLQAGFKKGAAVIVEVKGDPKSIEAVLRKAKGIRSVQLMARNGHSRFRILPEPGADPREEISRSLTAAQLPILELSSEAMTLEDIFVRVTASEEPTKPASSRSGQAAGGGGENA